MRRIDLTALLAAALLAACAPAAPDEQRLADDLQRDLDMARGTAVELAPRAGGQQVVSAIERSAPVPTPRTQRVGRAVSGPAPQVKAARQVKVGTHAPSETITAQVPEPVADTTSDTPVVGRDTSAVIAAPRPVNPGPGRKAPKGGWWGTGDVIRNAPFPVNPLTH